MHKPPISTVPIACLASAPASCERTKGIAPKTIAPVVIRIGRSLNEHDFFIASAKVNPSFCNWLANSTIKILCLLISPTKVTSPTGVKIFRDWPNKYANSNAPKHAKRTVNRIING